MVGQDEWRAVPLHQGREGEGPPVLLPSLSLRQSHLTSALPSCLPTAPHLLPAMFSRAPAQVWDILPVQESGFEQEDRAPSDAHVVPSGVGVKVGGGHEFLSQTV